MFISDGAAVMLGKRNGVMSKINTFMQLRDVTSWCATV